MHSMARGFDGYAVATIAKRKLHFPIMGTSRSSMMTENCMAERCGRLAKYCTTQILHENHYEVHFDFINLVVICNLSAEIESVYFLDIKSYFRTLFSRNNGIKRFP